MDERTSFEMRHRLAVFLHLAMVSSGLVAFLVSYLFSQTMGVSIASAAEHRALRQALYGAAFVMSIGVIVLRRWLFGIGRVGRVAQRHGIVGVIEHLLKSTIILGAISESVVLVGFVLSMLTRVFEDMWRLGGIGMVLLLYTYPWRSMWARAIERAQP
ncbi:MAG: hypothetical protein N0A16_03195 [Blastocatellia bacterium]|nr:hypothetical protein [Blastocatellia bacterium]MCS7156721.1 hypothetical protein [Blastocatellia bacterium]MCX7751537.1 hypothetical protein [Blastocatellia bacterium]MDW8168637.1 hypothetical protein [Acidobacteriota bacterium]MDW8256532.1 hypothetical protein [Acidobacteriota bacterium]